uniref:Uncharacterized protein n=1 Tax=Electrophorus electricus TaxID=8005 RepID=A0AAY5EDX8_ELEEL
MFVSPQSTPWLCCYLNDQTSRQLAVRLANRTLAPQWAWGTSAFNGLHWCGLDPAHRRDSQEAHFSLSLSLHSHGVAPCPSKTKPAAKPEGSRALGPAGPSCRPPWVTDPGFADRYRPDKTSTVVTQHSQRAEPTPEQSRCSIVQAALQGPAHGASSARTPLCAACSKVIRGRYVVALGRPGTRRSLCAASAEPCWNEGGFFEEQGSHILHRVLRQSLRPQMCQVQEEDNRRDHARPEDDLPRAVLRVRRLQEAH